MGKEELIAKRENANACVTFYHGGDSVTLLGKMTIVKDKETKDCMYQNWMDKHFPPSSQQKALDASPGL